MRKFFKKIFYLFAILYLVFWVLDVGFTYIFQEGYYTKIQWLYKRNNEQYDFVIHGNSRAYTTIDVGIVEAETGKKGLNISVDGSSIPDQYLMLKIFLLNNNKFKKLYLQVDPFSSDTEQIFDFAVPKFLPYMKDDIVFDHFKQFGPEWYAYRYIPFYRYDTYNTLWGLHEVLIDQFHLLKQDFDQYGDYFYPNIDYKGPEKLRTLVFNLTSNFKFLNQIIDLCKSHNVELILFTAPIVDIELDDAYYKNMEGFKQLMDSKGVKYYNYGDLYKNNPTLFYNEIHINRNGAEDFTKKILPIFK